MFLGGGKGRRAEGGERRAESEVRGGFCVWVYGCFGFVVSD